MKTKQQYCKWMTAFMDSWKNLDGVKTTELLSKDVKYYEAPLGEPCKSWSDVEALWSVVSNNQKNIEYTYEVVLFDDEYCFFNWRMTRDLLIGQEWKKQRIDGIFQVAVNDAGLCSFFKQWRYTETN